ncbi:MAG: Asp-tRNA(Asn)/Glu-tRNA(Gln) amidotransferase subunit GatC [Microgenomates group bacterium]
MSKLTKKQVIHVTELSSLKLTDVEIEKFTPQLDKIIEFVASLSEVNTDNVSPTSQTTGLTNVLRDDKVKVEPILSKDKALSGTDNQHNDFFKVPSILSERSSE